MLNGAEHMRRIAVLMTCYNRADTTLECLRRLFSQELPEGTTFDVWLVDDKSPDGTGDKVKAAYPQVNVVVGTGNLFWCKGMRLAWERAAASCDYYGYLWLNDDVSLSDGAIKAMLVDAKEHAGALIAGAVSDPATGRVCYGAKDKNGFVVPDGTAQKADRELNGNVLLVPKDVYAKLGMIDDVYLHGFGDYDYGRMAQNAGMDIYVASHIAGECRFNKGKVGSTSRLGLVERWRLLFSPLGFPLADTWYYHLKFDGFLRAIASCMHVMFLVMSGKR